MNFINHLNLVGQHAYLGASQHNWLNWSLEDLESHYRNHLALERGTRLHALAAELIEMKIKLPDVPIAFNKYVNDAIGFDLKPEKVLYYSPNVFGTADAINFSHNLLRIHDLKTGKTKTHIEQLEVYAALFCLEYDYKPNDIDIVLRIYQKSGFVEETPGADKICPIMDKIITFDKAISALNNEEI